MLGEGSNIAEPLIPEFSPLEVKIAIEKLKKYEFPSLVKFWQNWFKKEVIN
jgi:hypothetical protein